MAMYKGFFSKAKLLWCNIGRIFLGIFVGSYVQFFSKIKVFFGMQVIAYIIHIKFFRCNIIPQKPCSTSNYHILT